MTTLFRSILGGIDWNAPADALKSVDIFWMHLFHVFIGLACLALLNATELHFTPSIATNSYTYMICLLYRNEIR